MSTLQLPGAFQCLNQPLADDGTPVRYRAVHSGRGCAKTHSFCQELLLQGARAKLKIGCYREIQNSIKESVKAVLDAKINGNPDTRDFYRSLDTEIVGKNGTQFIFGGLRSNPEAIKSTEGLDRAVVFEANKASQKSLDLLIPTVRKAGSELWFEWNPDLPTDPVDVMFRGEGGAPPGSVVRRLQPDDNPFFPDVLRREMEYARTRDPEKYAWVWLGEYQRHSESRVFRNWRIEEFERPPGTVFRLGADWGFAIDPSCLVRCSIEGNRLYIDYEAYLIGCEIMQLPELFARVPESNKWFMTADSARPETISHMQKHGYPKIQPAIKGARSVEEGVSFLQSFDIIVHPRCTHVIDELTLYSYKTDPLTEKVLPLLEDKHNHCIDALRYACEGARRQQLVKAKPLKYDLRGYA